MKQIVIQIQPERNPDVDIEVVLEQLRRIETISKVGTEEGNDDDKYINIHCKTDDLTGAWADIKQKLYVEHAPLISCSIVTCEGDDGWNDYRLLHHFDKEEELTREEEDSVNAMAYHGQLLAEIMALFKIYCGLCGEHATEVEPALARGIFFTLFGSIEASCRVIAASLLLADNASNESDDPPDSRPVASLSGTERQFLWLLLDRTRLLQYI